jgi:hypothetical protein
MTEKVTEQQIAEWKEKYTQVVEAKADEHTAYFRNRQCRNLVMP